MWFYLSENTFSWVRTVKMFNEHGLEIENKLKLH